MLIQHSMLVGHALERVYDVIADVRSYPKFLPGCEWVRVHEQDESSYVTEMRVALRKLAAIELRTRTFTRRPDAIEVRLENGPFKALEIDWLFHALSQRACKVEFNLRCEFTVGLDRVLGPTLFERLSLRFIDAFVDRVETLAGASVHP